MASRGFLFRLLAPKHSLSVNRGLRRCLSVEDSSKRDLFTSQKPSRNQSQWRQRTASNKEAVTHRQPARRPRASNPSYFREQFEVNRGKIINNSLANESRGLKGDKGDSLAEQLQKNGEKLPDSCWVRVDNIPPLSSLDAILEGVQKALDAEQERGIIDLDAAWDAEKNETLPFLPPTSDEWVLKARVILSPFGRPTGWRLLFENRSIVHALLTHAKETPILCAWKRVSIKELPDKEERSVSLDQPQVTDATIRVENCPAGMNTLTLMHFFSRFDLTMTGPSIVQWHGKTKDGKVAPRTFLVNFADASWARAALREKQSAVCQGRTLRLAQFPKQIL